MDAKIERWLARDCDDETRAELQALIDAGDAAELSHRFAGRLAFGTAGLRGVLGAGPTRMNRLVVEETSAGLGAYLAREVKDAKQRGVVVGFDGRRGSRAFADAAACVLGAMGFRVHLFDRATPTPVCGFAVKELGTAAGIVITASHNPPEYNGYKVYYGNGAQIIPPHDQGIAACIDAAALADIPREDFATLRRQGTITALSDAMVESYLDGVAGLSIHPGAGASAKLCIAYTPLHGVGAQLAEETLRRAGFTDVHTVASQREPDGAFPTVSFPNPEEPGSMDAVIELAKEVGADIACAHDPDADRFAAAVRTPGGDYRMLSGDEMGVLIGDDVLRQPRQRSIVGRTIVSSRLLGRLAESRGVACYETLTGFKWLTNAAMEQQSRGYAFVFAYEEALGYALGDLVWDKDGVSALLVFSELCAHLAGQGKTILDRLESIYREHGLYLTAQRNIALGPNRSGPSVGDRLRETPPQRIARRDVLAATDLLKAERRARDGNCVPVALPSSDVLIYELEGGARVIVRPSGTEPKLKCYYEIVRSVGAQEPYAQAEETTRRELSALIHEHQQELRAIGQNNC